MNWYKEIKLAFGFPSGYWFTKNGPLEVREYEGTDQHEKPVIEQICKNHGTTLDEVNDLVAYVGANWEDHLLAKGFSMYEIHAFENRGIAMEIGFKQFGWVRFFEDSLETPSVDNEYMLMIKNSLLRVLGNSANQDYMIELYPSGATYAGVPFKMLEFIGSEKELKEFSKRKII